jgi:hypothetical protein
MVPVDCGLVEVEAGQRVGVLRAQYPAAEIKLTVEERSS